MAYYAASPPPDRAPSLAPTTTSDSEGTSKKKKTSFVKRALKELSGGGGNNAKQPKGAPVIRPYGRGGVGIKTKPSSTYSSPPNSVVTTSPSHLSPSAHPDLLSSGYTDTDQDDTQSVISSIPAPRRTQQWIQQQNPPQKHLAPPSPVSPQIARPIPTHYYPPESPAPSTFTRSSDDHLTSRQYAQYLSQQHQTPQRRLHDVQESEDSLDPTGELADQFGRIAMSSGQSSASTVTPNPMRDRNMAAQYRSATMPTAGYPPASPSAEPINSQDYYSSYYMGPHSQGVGREPLDTRQASSQFAAQQQITAQTHELQVQIDQLREAEKRARERLDALRKEDAASSSSASSSVPLAQTHANRGPSREDLAREEKEKLRQRDAAREREERIASNPSSISSGSPAPFPPAAQYSQPSFHHGYAPAYTQQTYSQPPYAPVASIPQAVHQDPNQQQLLLQLGTLLLQQQQQLAALGVGRGGSGYLQPDGKQPIPGYPAGGLDLNSLLALGAAQAAIAQQHTVPSAQSGYAPSTTFAGTSSTAQSHPASQTSTASSEVTRPPHSSQHNSASSPNIQPLQIRRKLSSGTPITNSYNRDQGNPPLPGSSASIPLPTSFSTSPFSSAFPRNIGLSGQNISPPPSSSLPLPPSAAVSSNDHAASQLPTSTSLSPPPPPYASRSS